MEVTFKVYKSNLPHRPDDHGTFATEAEALVKLKSLRKLVDLEADKDHPGCYDAFTTLGEVFCIERSPRVTA